MGSKGEISEAVAAEDASSQRTGTRRTIAIVLVNACLLRGRKQHIHRVLHNHLVVWHRLHIDAPWRFRLAVSEWWQQQRWHHGRAFTSGARFVAVVGQLRDAQRARAWRAARQRQQIETQRRSGAQRLEFDRWALAEPAYRWI